MARCPLLALIIKSLPQHHERSSQVTPSTSGLQVRPEQLRTRQHPTFNGQGEQQRLRFARWQHEGLPSIQQACGAENRDGEQMPLRLAERETLVCPWS